MRMVSPAFMTSGRLLDPSKSSALKAAFSLLLTESTCHVGEQTEYLFGAWTPLKPPSAEQLWTMASGHTCSPRKAWLNRECGLGPVTEPPHQQCGQTGETR